MKYRLNIKKFKDFLCGVFAFILCSGLFGAILLALLCAPPEARF